MPYSLIRFKLMYSCTDRHREGRSGNYKNGVTNADVNVSSRFATSDEVLTAFVRSLKIKLPAAVNLKQRIPLVRDPAIVYQVVGGVWLKRLTCARANELAHAK